MTKFADVTVGAELPVVSYPATRLSLVKYCPNCRCHRPHRETR